MKRLPLMLMALLVTLGIGAQTSADVSPAGYELTFDIPEQESAPVTGHEVLTFNLAKKQDVVLWFQGEVKGKCVVNKKKKPLNADGQRIVIPKKLTRAGANRVEIDFVSQPQAFNRQPDYMGSRFANGQAAAAFPCFNPEEPTGTFTVKLKLPAEWVSIGGGSKEAMAPQQLSFMAGRFKEEVSETGGRTLKALHRESDPARLAQLKDVLADAAKSLDWIERYTGVGYPLDHFAVIILPDYQPGGNREPGTIMLNDRPVFLRQNPTAEEKEHRLELIAHEVAHVWLDNLMGDKGNESVWAQEAFANFLAFKFAQAQDAKQNTELAFLRNYHNRALRAEKTGRTHALRQELDNMEEAGMRYGAIISERATVMMRKVEELMGEDKFRSGLQKCLKQYAEQGATLADFVKTMSEETPSVRLDSCLSSWIRNAGAPTIETSYENGKVVVRQRDAQNRPARLNQKVDLLLGYEMSPSRVLTVELQNGTASAAVPKKPDFIVPNYSGRGYGRFKLNNDQVMQLTERPIVTRNPLNRYVLLQTLYDNYLMGNASPYYFGEMLRTLEVEKDPIIIDALCRHMDRVLRDKTPADRVRLEQSLMGAMQSNYTRECHQNVTRLLAMTAVTKDAQNWLYTTWKNQNAPLLTERDYMQLAYYLAILRPKEWQSIVSTQRSRLTAADVQKEFDFVSRACTPDEGQQREVFESLLKPENRQQESWAAQALGLLSCNRREPQNCYMVAQALDALEDIQQTSSIFFASEWLKALLGDRRSAEAKKAVNDFITAHPDYPIPLKNKILEEASELLQ